MNVMLILQHLDPTLPVDVVLNFAHFHSVFQYAILSGMFLSGWMDIGMSPVMALQKF